jgi:hypothetical protein
MELADLLTHYGSDKNTSGYSHVYSILFDHIKNEPLNMLEIGIGTMFAGVRSSMKNYMPDTYRPGASLRAWRDYFVNSNIYGADIQPDTQFSEDRIRTVLLDSTNKMEVDKAMSELNVQFDIIIDDGWHWDEAQKKTLVNFFPYLKENGIYIIEDIYPGSNLNSTTPDVIKNVIGNYEHFFVGLKNNQCVIRKRITSSNYNC